MDTEDTIVLSELEQEIQSTNKSLHLSAVAVVGGAVIGATNYFLMTQPLQEAGEHSLAFYVLPAMGATVSAFGALGGAAVYFKRNKLVSKLRKAKSGASRESVLTSELEGAQAHRTLWSRAREVGVVGIVAGTVAGVVDYFSGGITQPLDVPSAVTYATVLPGLVGTIAGQIGVSTLDRKIDVLSKEYLQQKKA